MIQAVKNIFIFILLSAGMSALGGYFGGVQGVTAALILWGLLQFGVYALGDRWILSSYRAQPLSKEEAPEIYGIVRDLASKSGLPVPGLYWIPSASPNAFSVGRNSRRASIAITKGLTDHLNAEELQGVLAHEMAHVRNGDLFFSGLAVFWSGILLAVLVVLKWIFVFGDSRRSDQKGNMFVLFVSAAVLPLSALLIHFLVSRSRELKADLQAAQGCGNPLYLASALRKIQAGLERLPMRQIHLESSHAWIVSPLESKGWQCFFNTHPRVEERILRLEQLAQSGDWSGDVFSGPTHLNFNG